MKNIAILNAMVAVAIAPRVYASGHGPVFALATPTNAKGVSNFDLSFMDRQGEGGSSPMLRGLLGYGVTENLQVNLSFPVVFGNQPLAPARFTGVMPMGTNAEGIAQWRFFRRDNGVGSRIESTAFGGVIVPGPQHDTGPLSQIRRSPGAYMALSSGFASRSSYAWAGVSYSRYLESHGDHRPNVLFYSFAYGYRAQSWRTEYPRWDWRIFGELTGEHSDGAQRHGLIVPGTGGDQTFAGPSTLGTYKNYAVSAGIQFPVHRDVGPLYARERFRVSANVTYYFTWRTKEQF